MLTLIDNYVNQILLLSGLHQQIYKIERHILTGARQEGQ